MKEHCAVSNLPPSFSLSPNKSQMSHFLDRFPAVLNKLQTQPVVNNPRKKNVHLFLKQTALQEFNSFDTS